MFGSSERKARKQGKPQGSKLDSHAAFLLDLVKAQSDITLEEMQEALLRERGFKASLAMNWRFFDSRKITFKENRARFRTGAGRRGAGAREMAPDAAPTRS